MARPRYGSEYVDPAQFPHSSHPIPFPLILIRCMTPLHRRDPVGTGPGSSTTFISKETQEDSTVRAATAWRRSINRPHLRFIANNRSTNKHWLRRDSHSARIQCHLAVPI